MDERLSGFFSREHIEFYSPIPAAECDITKPHLLERNSLDISGGSALMILVPFYAKRGENISTYAVGYDYHLYFEELFSRLCPLLSEIYPSYRFFGFSDHSPIAEKPAAVRAGLGVIGKNKLLINEKYSSFVFIGEVLSDMPAEKYDMTRRVSPFDKCDECGLCVSFCPSDALSGGGQCLSLLSQTKGELRAYQTRLLRENGSAWGCDTCQFCCPHTKRAIEAGTLETPVEYFKRDLITRLTTDIIDDMEDEEFIRRAYSWHGREVILRNLNLLGDNNRRLD